MWGSKLSSVTLREKGILEAYGVGTWSTAKLDCVGKEGRYTV